MFKATLTITFLSPQKRKIVVRFTIVLAMFARQQVTAEHWVRIIALIGEGIGVRAIPRRLQTSRLVFV